MDKVVTEHSLTANNSRVELKVESKREKET